MKRIQEYNLGPAKWRNYKSEKHYQEYRDFVRALDKFGAHVDGKGNEYSWVIYVTTSTETVTMIEQDNNIFQIVANNTVLAEIKNEHLDKICVPGIKSVWGNIEHFFGDMGTEYLTEASFPDLVNAHTWSQYGFMQYAIDLKKLYIPKLETTWGNFLKFSQIPELNAPNLVSMGSNSLYHNETMRRLNLPRAYRIEDNCLYNNDKIRDICLPRVNIIGDSFLFSNTRLETAEIPRLKHIGINCQPLLYDISIANKTAKHR